MCSVWRWTTKKKRTTRGMMWMSLAFRLVVDDGGDGGVE